MTHPILDVRGASGGYGDFQALFSIDFEIASGEVVALIGANGAGKSTLLKTVAGLLPVREGTIIFDGEDISNLAPHKLVRKGLALVPEGRRLFSGMTVEDNLLVSLDQASMPVAYEARWTVERLFALFPILAEKRRTSVERLSGGQQQMVAIGRALMTQPRLLLCDEISLGLAPKVIREIYDRLPEVRSAGTAIVLVEQDIALAAASADRIYCLLEGRIALAGKASEIGREEIAAAYFGVHR